MQKKRGDVRKRRQARFLGHLTLIINNAFVSFIRKQAIQYELDQVLLKA